MGNKKSNVEGVNGSNNSDNDKSVESVEPKATRNTNPNMTGIRANLSNATAERFAKAEEVSGIDHSVLVEMAFTALFEADEATRKALYAKALKARGGVDVVSMNF